MKVIKFKPKQFDYEKIRKMVALGFPPDEVSILCDIPVRNLLALMPLLFQERKGGKWI